MVAQEEISLERFVSGLKRVCPDLGPEDLGPGSRWLAIRDGLGPWLKREQVPYRGFGI